MDIIVATDSSKYYREMLQVHLNYLGKFINSFYTTDIIIFKITLFFRYRKTDFNIFKLRIKFLSDTVDKMKLQNMKLL